MGTPPIAASPTMGDAFASWAGDARATSLPALLQYAVGNTPSLATATIDVAVAEARIQQTRARDDWRLIAVVNGGRSAGFVGGLALLRNTFAGVTIDATRSFSTGGTLTLRAASQYTRSTSTSPIIPDQSNWYDEVFVQYNQPLLRNRGRFLFEANERRAALSRDAAALGRRLAAIQAVQTVVGAYWDLVFAERQVAITRSSLELARERLRVTTIGNEGGKVPRSEIPAVQQIIATREEDVLNAELLVLDRSITLRRATGMNIGAGELGLRVGAELGIAETPMDLGQLVERAYQASPELAQLAKQDAAAAIDLDVSENGLLTRLDAAITIGPTGQTESFTESLKTVAKLDAMNYIGSLTLDHQFGNDSVRGLVREQRETKRRLAVTATDVRMQLALSMSRAVAQFEAAKRRVALSQRAIELATENIKIEGDRFSLGKSTNFDVLNRQEELRQAELRQAQAMVDWHKSEATVQALTGDILPGYGIDLK